MKNIQKFIFVVLSMSFMGCASTGFLMAKPQVIVYGQTYPSKNENDHIDIFQTKTPDRDYVEIARITCGDTEDSWNMKQILLKAREIGADAIIVIGESGSHGTAVPIGNVAYAVTEGYGISAIAVKYKQSTSNK